jgi:hypothetical protein
MVKKNYPVSSLWKCPTYLIISEVHKLPLLPHGFSGYSACFPHGLKHLIKYTILPSEFTSYEPSTAYA